MEKFQPFSWKNQRKPYLAITVSIHEIDNSINFALHFDGKAMEISQFISLYSLFSVLWKKVVGYVTQRRSGRERSRGVTKQKQTYMCFHLPVHTFLSFDIYIRIHLHIYTCNISICISISVYAICSRNTQKVKSLPQKRGSPMKRVSDEQLWITQETRRRHYDVRIGARANLPKDSGTPGRRKCQKKILSELQCTY